MPAKKARSSRRVCVSSCPGATSSGLSVTMSRSMSRPMKPKARSRRLGRSKCAPKRSAASKPSSRRHAACTSRRPSVTPRPSSKGLSPNQPSNSRASHTVPARTASRVLSSQSFGPPSPSLPALSPATPSAGDGAAAGTSSVDAAATGTKATVTVATTTASPRRRRQVHDRPAAGPGRLRPPAVPPGASPALAAHASGVGVGTITGRVCPPAAAGPTALGFVPPGGPARACATQRPRATSSRAGGRPGLRSRNLASSFGPCGAAADACFAVVVFDASKQRVPPSRRRCKANKARPAAANPWALACGLGRTCRSGARPPATSTSATASRACAGCGRRTATG